MKINLKYNVPIFYDVPILYYPVFVKGCKYNTTPMCSMKLRVRRGSDATERAARASPSVKYPGVIEPSLASHP